MDRELNVDYERAKIGERLPMPNIEYTVYVNYWDFKFDNYDEAELFMLLAMKSWVRNADDERSIGMKVKIIKEDEDE